MYFQTALTAKRGQKKPYNASGPWIALYSVTARGRSYPCWTPSENEGGGDPETVRSQGQRGGCGEVVAVPLLHHPSTNLYK